MKKRHWQASYGSISREIDADHCASVNVMLELAMQRFAEQPAFHGSSRTLTFSEVRWMSLDFAACLQKVAGLEKGDRVAVMLPNVLACPAAFIGIAQAGGVQVNVNPLYTARELQHQLEDSGAELIVIHERALPTLAAIVHTTRIQRVAYKVPRRIRFVDALPKSTVGKILRRELRLLVESEAEPEHNAVAQA